MAPTSLHIRLTGRLSIVSRRGSLAGSDLPGRQGRLTLARLAIGPGPVERDDLAEVLWPDRLPKSWERDLSAVVSKIRAAFGRLGADPDVLPLGGGAYELRLPQGSTVDVLMARDAIAAAEASRPSPSRLVVDQVRDAASTLRAVFLPGETAAWVDRLRDENRSWLVRALDLMASALADEGALPEAIVAAEEAVDVDHYREAAYVTLMQLQARAGNRAAAARAFERCRRALVDELGVEPAPATLAVFRDAARSDETRRPPFPAALSGRDRPFVGRRGELDELTLAWKRSRAGHRQVAVIGGEAGIGKTRLAGAAAEHAHASGATVLYGKCDREPVLPFQPVVEAVRALARAAGPELYSRLGPGADAIAALVPELTATTPSDNGGPRTDDRLQMFDAFAAAVSAPGPGTVLVVDDLQWATGSTLLLIRHLVRQVESVSIMLTYRDHEVSPALDDLLVWLDREPDVVHVMLSGLDEGEITELVAERTDPGAELDPQQLHRATAGNPFFLAELLYHRTGSGEVPRAIRAIVANRVARLGTDAHEALLVGALIGSRFAVNVVESALGGRDVSVAVDAAVREKLLRDTEAPGEVHFNHDIVREAVLAGASAVRQERLHLAVADAFERTAPERVDDVFRHLTAAGSHADARRVAVSALHAGRQALARLAWEDALATLRAGLDALGDRVEADPALYADLLLERGRASLMLGDRDAARDAGLRAVQAARGVGSHVRLAHAALLLYGRNAVVGEPDAELVAACADALAGLGEQDGALRAKVMAAIAEHRYSAEADEAGGQRLAEEALTQARASGDADALAAALWVAVVTLNASPDVMRAGDLVAEMVSLAGAANRLSLVDVLFMRMRLHLVRGDRTAAEEALRRIKAIHGETPLWSAGWHLMESAIVMAQLDGSFDDATRYLDEARATYAPADPNAANRCVAHEAFLGLEAGALEGVITLVSAVVEVAPGIPAFRAVLCLVLARAGDPAAARFLDELAAGNDVLVPRDVTWVAAVAMLAEASALIGSPAAADTLYRQLEPFAGTTAVAAAIVACLGAVDRYLGILASVLGDHTGALAHFENALAIEERLAAPPLLARTRFWQARTLIARGDPGDADAITELLDDVIRTSRRLGIGELEQATEAVAAVWLANGVVPFTEPAGPSPTIQRTN